MTATESLRERLDRLQQSTPTTESLSTPSATTSLISSLVGKSLIQMQENMLLYNELASSLTATAHLVNELFGNIERDPDPFSLHLALTEASTYQKKIVESLSSVKSRIQTSETSKSTPDSTEETVSSGTPSTQ